MNDTLTILRFKYHKRHKPAKLAQSVMIKSTAEFRNYVGAACVPCGLNFMAV